MELWKKYLSRTTIIILAILAIAAWKISSYVIGLKPIPTCGVFDQVHTWTAPLNHYLNTHRAIANFLLASSSLIIEAVVFTIIGLVLFKERSLKLMLSFALLLGLRQCAQLLTSLPLPEGILWHHPGFPTLFFIQYDVAGDLFFSIHTGVSVFAVLEFWKYHKTWLNILMVSICVFEVFCALTLRFHYNMDVFAGVLAAVVAYLLGDRWTPSVDRFFVKIEKKLRGA